MKYIIPILLVCGQALASEKFDNIKDLIREKLWEARDKERQDYYEANESHYQYSLGRFEAIEEIYKEVNLLE